MNIFSHGKDRTLFGCKIQQSWTSLYVLDKLLEKEKPTFICELGCASGILSCYFQVYANLTGNRFVSFDLNKPQYHTNYLFYQKDIRNNDTIKQISEYLNNTPTGMILIDAADKKSNDVNLYVPNLKSNTIILAHDYVTNPNNSFKWGFIDNDINCWNLLEKFEPYYSKSIELNTRMIYLKRK